MSNPNTYQLTDAPIERLTNEPDSEMGLRPDQIRMFNQYRLSGKVLLVCYSLYICYIIYTSMIIGHYFDKTDIINTCECLNTTGWNKINETTCCLDAIPSHCANTTKQSVTRVDNPINSTVDFVLYCILVIMTFYILIKFMKAYHIVTNTIRESHAVYLPEIIGFTLILVTIILVPVSEEVVRQVSKSCL